MKCGRNRWSVVVAVAGILGGCANSRPAMPTYDLTVTRQFAATVDQVWHAWSDAEHVKRWWAPTGFSTPSCRMDFREGGRTIVCMRAPKEFGGGDTYNSWTYVEINPKTRIEFIARFTDRDGVAYDPTAAGFPAGIPAETRQVVTLRDLGAAGTEMTVVEHGYTTEAARELSREGLGQCLDKMAASFVSG